MRCAGFRPVGAPLSIVIAVLVGLAGGMVATLAVVRAKRDSGLAEAKRAAEQLLEQARRDAEATRREAHIDVREAAIRARAEAESTVSERAERTAKLEERALALDEALTQRARELEHQS